jgi:hypothetical protein
MERCTLNTTQHFKSVSLHLLVAIFLYVGIQSPAFSSIVTSDELLSGFQAAEKRSELASLFDREDVRNDLIRRGVNPDAAQARIAGMTDSEIARLTQDMEKLPAGQGVLGIIALVLIILLLTEMLGYTNVSDKI